VIAADSSTWVAFLQAKSGEDVDLLADALAHHELRMVPAVLTELLSAVDLPQDAATYLRAIPRIELHLDFWENAGLLRAQILARGRRARLGDALIAESCLAEGIRLLTRDRDFQIFAEAAGLQLALFN
jgi:predicted nucleic acid-binding protein